MMSSSTMYRIVAGILLVLTIGAGTARGDIAPEVKLQKVRHLTAPTKRKLGEIIRKKMAQIRQVIKKRRQEKPFDAPSEVDWRTDFGVFEFGLDPTDPSGEPQLTEVTLKDPTTGMEVSWGCTGPWHDPKFNGKLKFGIALEGGSGALAGEYKDGAELDLNRTIDDLYDGEWQKRSEWWIIDTTERFLAHFDFYVGVAGGTGTTAANTGIEVTFSVRDAVTLTLFKDMFENLERLARAQDRYAKWRKDKVDAEARRVGVDPTGKNFNQVMMEIKARYAADPSLERKVFRKKPGGLTFQGLVSDWYCTNRPVVTMPLALPRLIEKGVPLFWKNLGDLIPPAPEPPKQPIQGADGNR